MFAMFKQLFMSITVFFLALEKTAKAVDHLASWGEETAAAFSDEARIERAKKLSVLQAELNALELKNGATAKPKVVASA